MWFDVMWCDVVYDVIWYDELWYMICDIILYIWYDTIWYSTIYDMIRYCMIYDILWYDINCNWFSDRWQVSFLPVLSNQVPLSKQSTCKTVAEGSTVLKRYYWDGVVCTGIIEFRIEVFVRLLWTRK